MKEKLLFNLRRLYLSYKAYRPKHLLDEELYKEGEKIWENFDKKFEDTPINTRLVEFQKLSISIDCKKLYCLQYFLTEYIEYERTHFAEYTIGREELYEQKFRDFLFSHLDAISVQ